MIGLFAEEAQWLSAKHAKGVEGLGGEKGVWSRAAVRGGRWPSRVSLASTMPG